jgi:hypothetical protein
MNSNLIINGNFDLWQRGVTFSIPYNAKYSNIGASGTTYTAQSEKIADRWYLIDTQKRTGGSTGQIQAYREQFSNTAASIRGSANYYLTISNQLTSITGGYCYIENKQENAKMLSGVPMTLSFSAKSASGVTGITLSCYYRQALNPNSSEVSSVISDDITIQPYWKSYFVTFQPSVSNFSGLSGDHYFSVGFRFASQSTVSIAGVKLQETNAYTSTILITDPQEEKTKQEKYYKTTYALNTQAASVTTVGGNDLTAIDFTVTPNYTYNYHFNTPMRKVPSITLYSPDSGVANDGYNKTAAKDMRLTSGTRGWNQVTRFSPTGAATLTTSGTTYGVAFNVATGAVVFDDILVHMVADADLDYSPYDRGLET